MKLFSVLKRKHQKGTDTFLFLYLFFTTDAFNAEGVKKPESMFC